ncbi:hypothetical protein [Promicromonospora soli]
MSVLDGVVVFDEADDFTPRSRCVQLEWLDDRIRLTEREGDSFAQVDALPFGFTQRGNHPTVPPRPGGWVRWLQKPMGATVPEQRVGRTRPPGA